MFTLTIITLSLVFTIVIAAIVFEKITNPKTQENTANILLSLPAVFAIVSPLIF